MAEDRSQVLFYLWGEETSDPETWTWREDLTPGEQDMVAEWDRQGCRGTDILCREILVLEDIRRRYRPEEILALQSRGGHYWLELRCGDRFDVCLDGRSEVRYHPADVPC